jgi:hypothetical protein
VRRAIQRGDLPLVNGVVPVPAVERYMARHSIGSSPTFFFSAVGGRPRQLVTAGKLAAMLDCSVETIRRRYRARRIEAYVIGVGAIRLPEDTLP